MYLKIPFAKWQPVHSNLNVLNGQFSARSRYLGHGWVIKSHTTALNTCFWHSSPQISYGQQRSGIRHCILSTRALFHSRIALWTFSHSRFSRHLSSCHDNPGQMTCSHLRLTIKEIYLPNEKFAAENCLYHSKTWRYEARWWRFVTRPFY